MNMTRPEPLRRLLQTILAAVAAIALVTGGLGLVESVESGYDVRLDPGNTANVMLDTNLRYFSGLWMGIGLALIVILRSVEQQVTALRMVSAAVFLGGIGRLVSMAEVGAPSVLFRAFAVAELAFPLLLLLQRRIRNSARSVPRDHG